MHCFSLPCELMQKLLIWVFLPIVTGSSRQGTLTGSPSQVQWVVCMTWDRGVGVALQACLGDLLAGVERSLHDAAVVRVDQMGGHIGPRIRVDHRLLRRGGRGARRKRARATSEQIISIGARRIFFGIDISEVE